MPGATISFTNLNANEVSSISVKAAAVLPLSTFYNTEGDSLIKFRYNNNGLEAQIDTAFTTPYTFITSSFHSIINSTLAASNASPFNLYNYSTFSDYLTCPNFGTLSCKSYAHYLFGNITFTSLIANSDDLINFMNGSNVNDAKYAPVIASTIMNLPNSVCTKIVEQIIDQDSSRNYTLGDSTNWQSVKFKSGDIVYFTLSVSLSQVSAQPGQQYIPSPTVYPGKSYHIATLIE